MFTVRSTVLGLSIATLSTLSASALELKAKAYYILEPATNTVVLQKGAQEKIGPASLTKLMTTYLVFDALKNGEITKDTAMPISEKAWRKGGSKMFLEVGKSARTEDLIKGIIVSSGNDACIVVAEYLAGTEGGFVHMMNEKAEELGLENTTFANANGWPNPAQVSTVEDMAKLAKAIIEDFPEYYEYFAIDRFKYNGISQANRNGLITRGLGIDGLKTGHIQDAGYHIVASGERNNVRLISVVMGTNSMRAREDAALAGLVYGWRSFTTKKVIDEGQKMADVKVWMGEVDSIPVTASKSIKFYMPKKVAESKISQNITLPEVIEAPITKGQIIGQIEIAHPSDGRLFIADLIASEDVAEVGFFTRVWRNILKFIGIL